MEAVLSVWTQDSPIDEAIVIDLYDSVGWSAHTANPRMLLDGLRNSLRVVVAHLGGVLVGVARLVGDGSTICYLQDVLVREEARHQGLGRALVNEAFAPHAAVRQHVSITDEEPGQQAFYEALGFSWLGTSVPGRAFVKLDGRPHRAG